MLPAGVPCFFPLPACERRSPRRESRRYNVTVLVRFLLLPESTLFFAGGLAELFNRIAFFPFYLREGAHYENGRSVAHLKSLGCKETNALNESV